MEKEEAQIEVTPEQEIAPKVECIFQEEGKYLTEEQVNTLMEKRSHLIAQTYDDIPTLNALSQCVMSRQATINIGTIGHVSHGKTTLVKAISGIHTIKFGKEKKRNITIKLGYANAKIFKCPKCPKPSAFKSFSSNQGDNVKCDNRNVDDEQEICGTKLELIRHISFVDCPGHEILMARMLTGASVMDAAILLVAGDRACPQPQTNEHLAAVEIMQLNHIIIVQNKVDLIFDRPGQAQNNYKQISEFVRGTRAEKSPIVPISAQFKYNIEFVLQYMCEFLPVPQRSLATAPKLIVIRSFDINKPGCSVESLKGGIAGGTLMQGVLKVGDFCEIRPGHIDKDLQTGDITCTPVKTRIVSLQTEENNLLYAMPGGLIGVGMTIDPYLSRGDGLAGSVVGYPGKLPDIYIEIDIEYNLYSRLLGVSSSANAASAIQRIQKDELLMINVGSIGANGTVLAMKTQEKIMKIQFMSRPVCSSKGEKVALSRRINGHWRLIGWGIIKKGKCVKNIK